MWLRVGESLRPIDLGRAVGLSAQTIRKYERWGFMPPAVRSLTGYRQYTRRHLHAVQATRIMMNGFGWMQTQCIMRLVHQDDDLPACYTRITELHAGLNAQRRELVEMLDILRTLAKSEVPPTTAGPVRDGLRIGEAAALVGVRVSALRFWEEQGLLHPTRDRESGYRIYDEQQLRMLRVVALLRRANYDFPAISRVLADLASGRTDQAIAAAERRLGQLAVKSRLAIQATAAFWDYVVEEAGIAGS